MCIRDRVNTRDDIKRWWEVMDRTTGQPLATDAWSYDEAAGCVVIPAPEAYHEYTAVSYTHLGPDTLQELEIAYAITVHKSQGTEFTAVVMPLSGVPTMLRYRNLLYTGVTRAKKLLSLIHISHRSGGGQEGVRLLSFAQKPGKTGPRHRALRRRPAGQAPENAGFPSLCDGVN